MRPSLRIRLRKRKARRPLSRGGTRRFRRPLHAGHARRRPVPRVDPRHRRQHAAGPPAQHGARLPRDGARQARVLQSRRQRQGPHRPRAWSRRPSATGSSSPGGTIVECTSGNTGLGLAMVAAVRGYRAVFCMPDKVSSEKVNLLKAFGAEVLLSPTAVAPESPESYYSVAQAHRARAAGRLPRRTSTTTRRTPRRTTRPPGPSCGSRPRARSRTSSPAWARAARSSGVGALPQGAEPEGPGDRRRSGGLDPQGTTTRPAR